VYWLSSSLHAGPFIVAVADCTGHGVPGAMLSLLVSNSLDRIYATDTTQDPATALLALDRFVRLGLNQDRVDSESNDGCDAAILRIDTHRQIVEFAGAKIGLFHVSNKGVCTRYLPAKCSLGYREMVNDSEAPQVTTIAYELGDIFSLVTDGVTDQPGGSARKVAYGYRRLEAVLVDNHLKSAAELLQAIKDSHERWQGKNSRRDDLTVLVFKI
jgi:serine phosphatase RsbU (regulator of sigma subunit)